MILFLQLLYLYSISHPSKHGVPTSDLSGDKTVKIEALPRSLSAHKQLAVERVIVKIFQFLRLNVAITDRIRSLFSTKLHRMGRSLQSLGGSRGKNVSNLKNGSRLIG